MKKQTRAFAFGIITVLLWSTVASAFKLSLRYLEPIQLLLYATATSVVTLFLILALQGKLSLIRSVTGKVVLRAGLLGILNPLLYYLILFEAYDLLPAQEAQALNYTWAVTLSLLSVPFLGQKLSLQELGAIILAYLGVLFIATHGNLLALEFSNTQGVLLALGSTLIWSFYWLANTRSRTDPVLVLFLNFAFALPLVVLVAYFSGHLAWPSISGLAGAIYVGMFEMGIAFVTWLHAMKLTTSTARLATLIYISPFISLVLIQQLVGEDIHWSSIAGLSLIVTGSLLQQLLHRKPT
jgi:drug/metabolite transporter (DMT)-like permease